MDTNLPGAVFQGREEFRKILCKVVTCLRGQLNVPGVSPFNPNEIAMWLNQVTPDDVAEVWDKPESGC